jgi:hypothetical protein
MHKREGERRMKKFLVSVALAIAVVTGYVEALDGIAHIVSASGARSTVSQSVADDAHSFD